MTQAVQDELVASLDYKLATGNTNMSISSYSASILLHLASEKEVRL